ncbi:MAG: hypothetical protein IKU41_05430 [Clostridia bacterium]|nr:hypothetical protein [Clostridia bacterium]
MKNGIKKVLDKVTDKINAKYEPFVNVLNDSLQRYCLANSLEFVPISMDEADYSTTINFSKFKIHFEFDIGSATGYRFMEGTLEELNSGFVDHNNLLARFEFDFSNLLFSPYDIHNVIRSKDFCTLDFHRISTPDEVEKCLQVIFGFIDKNIVAIKNIADNQQLQKEIVDNYFADVVALKKKAKLDEFETDIECAIDSHETELYCQTRLESGIDNFIRTGNSKELWFSYYRNSKKNRLILFEKRYVDYLFENDFPEPDKQLVESRKSFGKNRLEFVVSCIVSIVLAFVLLIFLVSAIDKIVISLFYNNQFYITTFADSIFIATLFLSLVIIVWSVTCRIRPNIEEIWFKTIDERRTKYINIATILSVVVFIISVFGFGISEKNTMVTTNAYGVYYNGEKVGTEYTIEFVHIQGYETYENGNTYFEPYDDYIAILNGDYEGYVYCDGLLSDDGSVNAEALNYIKGNGCVINTYRTLDDYCKAHNISTEE